MGPSPPEPSNAPPTDGRTPLPDLVARVSSGSEPIDRIAAAHRLNELFAACRTAAEASELASTVCQPAVCEALVQILTDGEQLSEVAATLLLHICLDEPQAREACSAGLLPVLIATLRADDALFREHGLALLSSMSEHSSIRPQLLSGGVCRLIGLLAPRADAACFHWLVGIADSLLRSPTQLRPAQSQQLLDAFVAAETRTREGGLVLEAPEARLLSRVLGVLRVVSTAVVVQ